MKTLKRLLSLLLVLAMVVAYVPSMAVQIEAVGNTTEFAGGSGTQNDPYLISTKKHLYNIRNYPSAYFLQTNDVVFEDADFVRGGDFYNGGYGWEAFDFSGCYDGGNYKIKNLQGTGGLFANLSGATVKNLDICAYISCTDSLSYSFGILGWKVVDSEISNCCVSGTMGYENSKGSSQTSYYIGSICGYLKNSNIYSCTNNVKMVLDISYPGMGYFNVYVGGLCGRVESKSTISDCKNYSDLEFGDKVTDIYALGGIAGATEGLNTISGCTNYGNIGDHTLGAETGGIAGLLVYTSSYSSVSGRNYYNCAVKDCTNYGMIESEESGGICGSAQFGASFTNCNNYGTVTGNAYSTSYAGGICGDFSGLQISRCSNFAEISSTYGTAGGITGDNSGEIIDCINHGTINATTAGGITGRAYASGLATDAPKKSNINNCCNLGNVSGSYSGGVCGKASYGIVQQCYNTGAVHSKNTAAGGIVGDNAASIKDCYNVGNLTTTSSNVCLGGIVGKLSGTVDCCYTIGIVDQAGFFGGICGQNDNRDANSITKCFFLGKENLYSVGKGYGEAADLSGEEMRLSSSFSGFDFDAVWTMAGNAEYLYPELRSVEMQYSCNHSYSVWTKNNDATHMRTCSICSNKEIANHTWDSGKVTKAATCKVTGVKTYTCTACNAKKTETIAKTTDHKYGSWTKVNDTTHKHTCSVCQKEETANHSWNGGSVTQKATCKETGVKIYICTACNATKTDTIAKLTTHTYDHACDTDCNVCGVTRTTTHNYKTTWSKDKTNHWHECSICKDKKDMVAHTPGAEATETTPQTCTTCGYIINPTLGHTHKYDTAWTTDENGHWYACAGCEEQGSYATHDFENACDKDCSICGYTRETSHNYSEDLKSDKDNHWYECTGCGLKQEEAAHEPGAEATETTAQTCTICGYEIAPALGVKDTEPTTTPVVPAEPVGNSEPSTNSTVWIIVAVVVVVLGGVGAGIITWKKKH